MKSLFPFTQALHSRTGIGLLFCLTSGLHLHAQGPQLTLTPTLHNGYHITCFGKADGTIDLSVTGGTSPYTYMWTTGATTQDVSNLRAGYISVLVKDAANVQVRADMTLTEPRDLLADVVPYEYGNGHNVSCFECFNGSIQVTATDGAPPYTYAWADGPTVEDRTQLGAGNYSVNVTDANGCELKGNTITLRQPDRTDWTMNGNAGTNPGTQFIGTSDNKDLVFKSNGSERLRLNANGDMKVATLASSGDHLIYADHNGILKRVDWPVDSSAYHIPWYLGGNFNVPAGLNRIGPINAIDFILMTTATERMRITTAGRVGIGTNTPEDRLDVHHADERGGIRIVNDHQDANAHSEIRFMKGTNGRWALGCDMAANGGQDFFLWDQVAAASRLRVDADGRVLVGNAVAQNSTLYKLYVEGGIVSRDVKVTANDFPDYVFGAGYHLMPLDEVRKYIHLNGHLPNFPTAEDVQANEGVEVGDLQLRLLRAVEEQQLYILELNEEIALLKARLTALEHAQR